MPTYLSPINPPLSGQCRNCGEPIVATSEVMGPGTNAALREYWWTHTHGARACRTPTVAQPDEDTREDKTP